MTNNISLIHRFTILGRIISSEDVSELNFQVPIEGCSPAVITVNPGNGEVIASLERSISTNLWRFLQKNDFSNIPSGLQKEISTISSDIIAATRKVLSLIKYCLGCIDLNESLMSHKAAVWCTNGDDWKPWPTIMSGYGSSYGTHPLNVNTASAIQQCIDRDFQPFLALRHLHKARKEGIPQYKWIEATIAAELAIKEFLIRLKPDLKMIILEMQAPPLHTLYGKVLESFGLPRSPKLKQISEGATIRNKLVHRPEEVKITYKEADIYVKDVEDAIFHLMYLLYPDDNIIKFFYNSFRFEDSRSKQ